MQITDYRKVAIAGTALLAVCGVLRANPSNRDFDAALAVHGQTLSPELQQRAQSLYETANKSMIGFAKAINSSRDARLDGRELGRTHLALLQMGRLGGRLVLLGEPAGADYQARANVLRQGLNKIIPAYRSTRLGQAFIETIRLQIRKQAPVRMKTLVKVQELANQQKWEQAEDVLYELLDMLETGTVFLTSAEHQSIYEPFDEVRAAVDRAMFRIRKVQANDILSQSRQAQTPDFAAVDAQMKAAARALATSAQVPWAEESLTGPELVDRFGQKWREIQVKSLRCQALDWAMQSGASEMYEEEGEGDPSSAERDRITGPMRQFTASVEQAIAQAIDADAQRASAEEAVRLYHEYLSVLAPLARQAERSGLASVVEPPLKNLASKSDAFAQEVAAYQAATDELLRWRRRVAAGRAAAQAAGYPAVEKPFFEATRNNGEYKGLFPERDADPRFPALQASAPQVMPVATERLMGQAVAVHDVVRLPGQSRAAIARHRMRTYANLPTGLNVASELDSLKFDLMVGNTANPLTLAAMQSLTSAERGDFSAVGGTISGIHLESLITRFASLPEPAAVLMPLGVLPREDVEYRLHAQMLMRFDIQPQWAQHDHFFVEFTPPADAAASQ
jgi:hypothetical protein